MGLQDITQEIPGFGKWLHVEKIKFFGWYLHTQQGLELFSGAQLLKCYNDLHLDPPGNIHSQLADLVGRRPRQILKMSAGYKLEGNVRESFNKKYSVNQNTIKLTQMLEALPALIKDESQREYLDEAIKCFKVGSPRAAIVMTWNLAYSHLCTQILSDAVRLAGFNKAWTANYPGHHKNKILEIKKIEDFSEELKESQVLVIAKSAGVITGDLYKILHEKLGRRNSAAHPSRVVIGQLQAEEFVDDLVKNVILKL